MYKNICQNRPGSCRTTEVGKVVWNKDTLELELVPPKSKLAAQNESLGTVRDHIEHSLPHILKSSFGAAPPRDIKKRIKLANHPHMVVSDKQRAIRNGTDPRSVVARARKGELPDCLRAWHLLPKAEKRARLDAKRALKEENKLRGARMRKNPNGRKPPLRYKRSNGPCAGDQGVGRIRPNYLPFVPARFNVNRFPNVQSYR